MSNVAAGGLSAQHGHHLLGLLQRDERRRLLHGHGVRPEHPALYQQLHHHPAADRGHPRPGAAGQGRRRGGPEEDPVHHPLRHGGHRHPAGLRLLYDDAATTCWHPTPRHLAGPGHHRHLRGRLLLRHVDGRAGQRSSAWATASPSSCSPASCPASPACVSAPVHRRAQLVSARHARDLCRAPGAAPSALGVLLLVGILA